MTGVCLPSVNRRPRGQLHRYRDEEEESWGWGQAGEDDNDEIKQRPFGASGTFKEETSRVTVDLKPIEEAGHVLDGPKAPSCGQSM